MARPVRKLWRIRTVVRRRHRTWMASMCLASVGWGSFWVMAVWMRIAPDNAPSVEAVCWFSGVFAFFGLLAALFTIRARTAWLLFTLIPLFANGSLLALPLVIRTLRVIRTEQVNGDGRSEERADVRAPSLEAPAPG